MKKTRNTFQGRGRRFAPSVGGIDALNDSSHMFIDVQKRCDIPPTYVGETVPGSIPDLFVLEE
jgi:hypothetical protein